MNFYSWKPQNMFSSFHAHLKMLKCNVQCSSTFRSVAVCIFPFPCWVDVNRFVPINSENIYDKYIALYLINSTFLSCIVYTGTATEHCHVQQNTTLKLKSAFHTAKTIFWVYDGNNNNERRHWNELTTNWCVLSRSRDCNAYFANWFVFLSSFVILVYLF